MFKSGVMTPQPTFLSRRTLATLGLAVALAVGLTGLPQQSFAQTLVPVAEGDGAEQADLQRDRRFPRRWPVNPLDGEAEGEAPRDGERDDRTQRAEAPRTSTRRGLPPLPEETEPGARFFSGTRAIVVDEAEALRLLSGGEENLITGSLGDAATEDDLEALQRPLEDEEDLYAALGVRAGPLTWFPAIDLAIGVDSNPDNATNGSTVRTVRLSPELRVESDWRRHAFTGSVRGTLDYVDDGRDLGRSLTLESNLRLDLGADITTNLRGGYTLTGEPISDPDAPATASGTADTQEFSVGFDAARTFGLVELTAALDVSRSLFSDTPLAGGGVQSNSDRDRTEGTLTLRLERAEGPILRPFVEASATLRRFDERLDRNGLERDSLGYGLRGGLTISDDGPLSGSLSAGVVSETFADPTLDDVVTLEAQAGLTWDVTALTSVTLDVATSLDPTTQAGSGVGISRSATLGLSHDLRRNVELRASAGIEDTDFSGIDNSTRTYTGGAGLTWRLSRVAAIRFDATYEHEPNATGDVNRFTAEAGFTLRR
ncbi:MAG: hypothetical protein Rhims3KO_16450 [Hyphomicrobiales bacterium]